MGRSHELNKARKEKKDEFYTSYDDIEKEISYYGSYFQNKIVYCNCDNRDSMFLKFFLNNYNKLELRGLIATGYRENSNGDYFFKDKYITLFGRTDNEGSYSSEDNTRLLELCDVVVTNPPFSKFRAYLKYLTDRNKDFLLLGNINSLTNKDIFDLIRSNRLWLGASIHSGDREFRVPDDYPLEAAGVRVENDIKYIRVKGVRWITNIRHSYIPTLNLSKNLNTAQWQYYDNYDGINVNKVSEIPSDYFGKIGVPITYLDKHNSNMFEILGLDVQQEDNPRPNHRLTINGQETYARIIIRRKDNVH